MKRERERKKEGDSVLNPTPAIATLHDSSKTMRRRQQRTTVISVIRKENTACEINCIPPE